MHTRARGVPQDVDPAFFARIATANAPTSVDTGYNARPVNRETAGPFSATIYRGAARVGQAPEISVAPNPAAFSGFSATRRYTSEGAF